MVCSIIGLIRYIIIIIILRFVFSTLLWLGGWSRCRWCCRFGARTTKRLSNKMLTPNQRCDCEGSGSADVESVLLELDFIECWQVHIYILWNPTKITQNPNQQNKQRKLKSRTHRFHNLSRFHNQLPNANWLLRMTNSAYVDFGNIIPEAQTLTPKWSTYSSFTCSPLSAANFSTALSLVTISQGMLLYLALFVLWEWLFSLWFFEGKDGIWNSWQSSSWPV